MSTWWVVERTANPRFPWRITLRRGGRLLLALRAQDKWPGSKGNVFCLREPEDVDDLHELEPDERVPVLDMRRFGKRLTLVLDRARQKRCDFLFLTKPYKDRPGEYEQIFFRTQQGLSGHRARGRLGLFSTQGLQVVVDSNERYPWRFANAERLRRSLPVGDYALLVDDEPAAVVERKTYDNMLGEMGRIQILHQQFADLARFPHAAVVIEARYSDFLDPKKVAGRWAVTHVARVLAELAARHPRLPMIYAGNRKLANEWVRGWFAAIAGMTGDEAPPAVAEAAAGYRPGGPGTDLAVRRHVLREMPERFTMNDLRAAFDEIPTTRLRRVLHQLREEGRLSTEGRGRGTVWCRQST